MLHYSLCIEPVLGSIPFYKRIEKAKEIGFDGFEFWNPVGKDLSQIKKISRKEQIKPVLCAVHDHRKNYVGADGLEEAVCASVKKIKAMGCGKLLVMSADQKGTGELQMLRMMESLKRLENLAEKEQVTFCLEPLNSLYDHKGYYLDSARRAFDLVRCVGSSHIKVLYDIYHMQIMEGNILNTLMENLEWIGHIHLAGVPGRHEPSSGELNLAVLLPYLKQHYTETVGLEYWPVQDSEAGIRAELMRLKEWEA